ncbi:hypothetical protein ABH935_006643 [Catenulispora sp. GAS73]
MRDRRIVQSVRGHGWHVMGVYGDKTEDWAYSIGLWHSLRSPEVCLMGVTFQTAMRFVNKIGDQIRDGRVLEPDERRDGVLTDRPITFRPVHPSWYNPLFGAGLDFTQAPPWPMVQAIWPDKAGLFPWGEGVDDECRTGQPMLWLDRAGHPAGPWTGDELGDWPFAPTMPYYLVLTTQAVLDGTPVGMVARDPEGTWHMVPADAPAPGDVEAPLMQLVNLNSDLVEVAGLQPGAWIQRGPDGTWPS